MAAKKTSTQATVLVVDDDSGVRDVFAEVLSDAGYRVVVAAEAESATKTVKQQRIDLALVDIWLKPGIDGIELIKQWRDSGLQTFPIGVVSGHAEVPTAVLAMRHGAMDVLTKPLGAKPLLEFVAKALAKKQHVLHDQQLQIDLGTIPSLAKLKGQLLKRSTDSQPILFIGTRDAGCELFARLIHPAGKPWIKPRSTEFLTKDPTAPLANATYGSIYFRDITGLSEIQLRGLTQLLHNAIDQDVRIIIEAEEDIDALVKAGTITQEIAKLIGGTPIKVPPVADFVNGLTSVITTAARALALEYGRSPDCFTKEAIDKLANEGDRWSATGLGSLLGIMHVLLDTAGNEPLTNSDVEKLLFAGSEGSSVGMSSDLFLLPLRDARTRFERIYFQKLVERANHNYIEAAKISGLERSYLYRKVRTLLEEWDENKEGKQDAKS